MISRRAAAATATAAIPKVNKAKLTNRSMLLEITCFMVPVPFLFPFMLHSVEPRQSLFRVGRIGTNDYQCWLPVVRFDPPDGDTRSQRHIGHLKPSVLFRSQGSLAFFLLRQIFKRSGLLKSLWMGEWTEVSLEVSNGSRSSFTPR